MFNFLAITLEVPSEVAQAAGQLGEPGSVGNLLAILVFFIVIFVYGFLLDRHNMVANLFSLYIALLAVKFFPYEAWQLGDWAGEWWGKIIILAVTIMVSNIILSISHLFKVSYASNFIVRWWQAIVSSILYSGLLIAIVLSILPAGFLNQFSPGFANLFISDTMTFFWLVAPVVGLILIKHKKRRPGRPSY